MKWDFFETSKNRGQPRIPPFKGGKRYPSPHSLRVPFWSNASIQETSPFKGHKLCFQNKKSYSLCISYLQTIRTTRNATLCKNSEDVKRQFQIRKRVICLAGDKSRLRQIYRKIPKISPSMYKPLQILAPQTGNAKDPPLNRPSKYKLPRGLYLKNCPQIQSKTKPKW